MTVYRQDFSEEVSRVNKARKEDKTEKVRTLAGTTGYYVVPV